MPVNQIEEITFKLWPTSILIKKGHSIRIAITGEDKDIFDRIPVEGTPVYTMHRNMNKASFIDLPIIK
jgi:predicted acyl esterase